MDGTGYLATLSSGWLHRDPSIGNALKLTKERHSPDSLEKTLFPGDEGSAQLQRFAEVSSETDRLAQVYRSRPLDFHQEFSKATPEIQSEYEQLKEDPIWPRYQLLQRAKDLGLAENCLALQTDFDLSAKLDTHVEMSREIGPAISVSDSK